MDSNDQNVMRRLRTVLLITENHASIYFFTILCLFHRHALGAVPGLVHIQAAQGGQLAHRPLIDAHR
jgi:hypothetical protein